MSFFLFHIIIIFFVLPGCIPSFTKFNDNFADFDAILISHAIAKHMPAPTAGPLIAKKNYILDINFHIFLEFTNQQLLVL